MSKVGKQKQQQNMRRTDVATCVPVSASASNLLGVDELDPSPGDGGLRGKKFALDAADVCAHTACGDDEAVADGDPRQLSVVERRECVLSFSFLTLRGTHRLRPQAH